VARGGIYTLRTLAQERHRLRDAAPEDGGALAHQLRQRGVETVILAGADTHGIMRGKRVPIAELARVAERGIALCEVIWALPVDEAQPVPPPPGHAGYFPRAGYPDTVAVPDLATARVVPWHDRTALLLCDFVDRGGSAVPLSPRAVLRSVVARARSMGVEPILGIELELYLLRETPGSVVAKRPSQLTAVQERPSAYGVVAASRHEPFAGMVRDILLRYGLAVEACNPEAGPGQLEINLRAAPALQAADDAFLLKSAVKEIAARQGLLATFMAKPRSDWPGSSCHLHLSLLEGDSDGFHDPAAPDGMSATMRHFVGGLLAAMAELSAMFAPTPNSYRRLVPYSWAATTATWSLDNRSAGVRVVCDGDGATRVEHRQAGADANPYLAAAAALAAGLDGVQRACEPPAPIDADVYALPDGAVPPLPATFAEATDLLERSALARDWLGDDLVEQCVAMRRAELAAQAAAVTDWETSRYLEAL
jgi:glutamine synthetase